MQKRYVVTLTDEERTELRSLISQGKSSARKLTRARILLLADQVEGRASKSDSEIAEAVLCGRATVERVRKQFVEQGIENTLTPKPSVRTYENKIDGRAEAHLIAMTCGAPPEGHSRWTLRLLADQMVALGHIDSVSHETVRMTLKKTTLSRG